jgi:hypothetical protein
MKPLRAMKKMKRWTLFTHRGEILTTKNKGDFKGVVNILSPAAYNRKNSFENPQAERCRRI